MYIHKYKTKDGVFYRLAETGGIPGDTVNINKDEWVGKANFGKNNIASHIANIEKAIASKEEPEEKDIKEGQPEEEPKENSKKASITDILIDLSKEFSNTGEK